MNVADVKPDYYNRPACGSTPGPGEHCTDCQVPARSPEQRIAGILEQANPLHELFSKKKTPNGGDR